MLRDETIKYLSTWPAKAGLKKIIFSNRGFLTDEEQKLFTNFKIKKPKTALKHKKSPPKNSGDKFKKING